MHKQKQNAKKNLLNSIAILDLPSCQDLMMTFPSYTTKRDSLWRYTLQLPVLTTPTTTSECVHCRHKRNIFYHRRGRHHYHRHYQGETSSHVSSTRIIHANNQHKHQLTCDSGVMGHWFSHYYSHQ